MSASDEDELQRYLESVRGLVKRILGREIARETHPIMFRVDDDALFLQLVSLEQHDPGWLKAQLADERYPREARELLASVAPHDPDAD